VREGNKRRLPVEVEVKNLEELSEALSLSLDRILLDNISVPLMREAVLATAGKVPLEASGGVTLETVSEIAATGVDFISVGALTHSVSALDISLEITSLGTSKES
jgi:nicotinate-nucleotide pyrophosphorylase (carboxylating)